jgi:hypothetical protein
VAGAVEVTMSLSERLAKIQCELILIKVEELTKDYPLLDIQIGAIKYETDKAVDMLEETKD